MSAYEGGEPVRDPERRIGWRGWVVVWSLYCVVLVVIGVVALAAGGGAP